MNKAKKVLITGGAGFIGSHTSESFLEKGYDVTVVDDLSTGRIENVSKGVTFFQQSITSSDFLSLLGSNSFDVVVHLASQVDVRKSMDDPVADAEVNILGFLRMMEILRKKSPKCRVVFSSTAGVYGDVGTPPLTEESPLAPLSPYAISKAATERYLNYYRNVHGLETVTLRFANVYGPRQNPEGEAGVVSIFCSRIQQGRPMTIFGDGHQTRDYIYVKDVANAIVKAAETALHSHLQNPNNLFNIGTGTLTSVLDLAERLQSISGISTGVEFAPKRMGEILDSSLDATRARDTLGWLPKVSLANGLKTTYESVH